MDPTTLLTPPRSTHATTTKWRSAAPSISATVLVVLFFGVSLLILRPGYWINDDLKIIWNVTGYPGAGQPVVYMIQSNFLVGMFLAPLYGLRTDWNWHVLLLAMLNICSVWSFLYVIFRARRSTEFGLVGSIIILVGVGTLTLNITYTVTAVLVSTAGFALFAAAATPATKHWRRAAAGGVALVLTGALLRIQALLLVLPLATLGLMALSGRLKRRRLLGMLAAASLLVFGTYNLDILYVDASPEWRGYYAFSRVRPQLHDTHRLNNLHNQIRRVGWTGNDQELFARWFYPDETRYSLENIQYLIDRTSPVTQDLPGSLEKFIQTLSRAEFSPYLLWIVAISLWISSENHTVRRLWGPLCVWATALALNLGLTLAYKDPDYVLASTLSGSVAFSTVMLALESDYGEPRGALSTSRGGLQGLLRTIALVILGLGAAAMLGGYLEASRLNAAKQADYRQIREELASLQHSGQLGSETLIISPAHGLPYEWSDPLKIDLPVPAYLDTGWITFSPNYERVLREYEIDSLPDALFERNNLFLMTDSSFTGFLGRYYEEHRGIRVQFNSMYAMPNPSHLPGYDDIHIYRLQQVP